MISSVKKKKNQQLIEIPDEQGTMNRKNIYTTRDRYAFYYLGNFLPFISFTVMRK